MTPHVRIWRQRDGLWRWRFVQPGSADGAEVVLVAHRAFDSREAAVESARAAYPGLELRDEVAPTPRRSDGPLRRIGSWLIVLAVGFHVLRWLWRERRAQRRAWRALRSIG